MTPTNDFPTFPTVSFPNTLTPFRAFCQQVLPTVYDDSLTYYELVCKVIHYLNQTMSNVNDLNSGAQQLYKYVNRLQEWVDNYFTNLDVQEEINKKLDEMAADGTLAALVNYKLRGRNIVFYGDSTFALPSGDKTTVEYFAEKSGASCTNRCIAGTYLTPTSVTTPDQSAYWLMQQATSETLAGFTDIFLCYGTNDWQAGVALESTTPNPSTGDISISNTVTWLINRIRQLNPDINIVFVTPAFATRTDANNKYPGVNSLGYTFDVYGKTIAKWCDSYNRTAMCINLDEHTEVDGANYTNYMLADSGTTYVHYKPVLKQMIANVLTYRYPYTTVYRSYAQQAFSYSDIVALGYSGSTTYDRPVLSIPASAQLQTMPLEFSYTEPTTIEFDVSGGNLDVDIVPLNLADSTYDPLIKVTRSGHYKVTLKHGFYNNVTPLKVSNNGAATVQLYNFRFYHGTDFVDAMGAKGLSFTNYYAEGVSGDMIANFYGPHVVFGNSITFSSSTKANQKVCDLKSKNNTMLNLTLGMLALCNISTGAVAGFIYASGGDLYVSSAVNAGNYRVMGVLFNNGGTGYSE